MIGTDPLTPHLRHILKTNIANRAQQLAELPYAYLDHLSDGALDAADSLLESTVETIGQQMARAATGEELDADTQGTEYVGRYLDDAALARAQDAAPTGETRPRFVIRYEPTRNPRFNDARLTEALELVLSEVVMTTTVHRNEVYGNLTYYVGLHADPGVVDPESPDWQGDGETYLEALRAALGDFYGDSDYTDRAAEQGTVIDAYAPDGEVIATRAFTPRPGAQW